MAEAESWGSSLTVPVAVEPLQVVAPAGASAIAIAIATATASASASASATSMGAVSSSSAQRPPLARPRAGAAATRPLVSQRRPRQQPAQRAAENAEDSGSSAAMAGSSSANKPLHTLRAFVKVVSEEITTLVAAFQDLLDGERCFSAFLSLWSAHRLSALFHVEFWDSTPSDTHHAILQVALELLVDAVGACATDQAISKVAKTIGHCFALYSAYSVQLSQPKIKIAVDPMAWQVLSQLTDLLTQQLATGTALHGAAREALAMLRRLEHQDDAFLKCLGGSVTAYRLVPRSTTRQRPIQMHDIDAANNHSPVAVPPLRPQEDAIAMAMRLEALENQYNSALQQMSIGGAQRPIEAEPPGAATNSGRGGGGGGERGRGRGRGSGDRGRGGGGRSGSAPSFLRRVGVAHTSHTTTITAGSNGDRGGGLWSEQRVVETNGWLTRLRQSLAPAQSAVDESFLDLAESSASRESDAAPSDLLGDTRDSDVDAAVLALEHELELAGLEEEEEEEKERDDQDGQQVFTRRRPEARRMSRAMSIASSGQESDGLEQLEAELSRDVEVSAELSPPWQVQEERNSRISTRPVVVAPRRRPRAPSVQSIDTESDGLAELEAELLRETQPREKIPSQPRPLRVAATPRRRAPSIASSDGGLMELEAELTRDLRPDLRPVPPASHQPLQPQPRSPQVATARRPPTVRHNTRMSSRSSDAGSVDDLLALQQELDAATATTPTPATTTAKKKESVTRKRKAPSASPVQTTLPRKRAATQTAEPRARARAPAVAVAVPLRPTPPSQLQQQPRRSRRLSDVSSVMTESDAELAALQAELALDPSNERLLLPGPVPAPERAPGPQPPPAVSASRPQRQRSLSAVSSTTESDEELKQLTAELATSVVAPPRLPLRRATPPPAQPRKRAPPTKTTKPAAATKPTPRKPRQPRKQIPKHEVTRAQVPPPPPVAILAKTTTTLPPPTPAIAVPTRLSSRRSTAASSSYDSDGLDDLERELQAFQ